jgi:hypothetical protein
MGTYNALVDLMAHRDLGEKTLLFMLDAFYVAQDQSSQVTAGCRWQSPPFDDHWTSSLFLSQDGVAIDSVGYDFLRTEPVILAGSDVLPPGNTAENYLHEASCVGSSPSGTAYASASLGVHEHWNNATRRQYSRNLGTGPGIGLVQAG